MIGIRSAVPIGLVAAVAGSRQRGVVVVGVALRALQGGVCTREREGRVVVIKGGRAPARGCVADGAVRRES